MFCWWHVVHVCVHGASMHKCVFWWCMYVYMTHIYAPLIGDACGACMCMWCIYVHIYVFGVHECKQVVFHA